MKPQQLSAIHAHLARGGERDGAGIGLDLIVRPCEHLGWTLTFDSQPQRGTIARPPRSGDRLRYRAGA